jgi:hypothetical protein
MRLKVNQKAVEKAKQLIDEGKFRINTPWREIQPSDVAELKYLTQYGLDEYGQWYLALDSDVIGDSKDRYRLPFGDFNAVHRSGVIVARQRAAENHALDIETAADEILDLFDRLNAC